MLFIFFYSFTLRSISTQNLNPYIDIKTLSELPLEKLLQVQNSFKIQEFNIIDNQTIERKNDNNPIALPLKSKNDILNRYEHDDYDDHHQNEKSKIQSIFQLSVTALAFLSFGGYLLCLIVNAIRSKQIAVNNATATQQQILAAIINAQTNRQPIRITRVRRRRPRRPNINNNNNKRKLNRVRKSQRKRNQTTRHKRETNLELPQWPDNIHSDDMYYALLTISEAYKNYHTTDYKRYNETITRNGI